MAKPILTNVDFERVAKKLKCEVAAIKAVAEVESRGQGFYASGFPVILFERHKFRSFTQGRYNKSHPHLSGSAGGYGKAGQNQVNKFNEAFGLNPIAAMKSCSWGKFQIMGFNHEVCGFATVGDFVDAMKESEGRHLDAFAEFVIGNNLARHLRNLNWATFANGYNGASYRINHYDTKMASAYAKHRKLSAAVQTNPEVKPATNDLTESPQAGSNVTGAEPQLPPPTESDITIPAQIDGVKPYNEIGLKGTLINDGKALVPANFGLGTISEYLQQTAGLPEWIATLIPKLFIAALVLTLLWILYRFVSWVMHNWRENERVKLLALINTDITRKNVELK